MRNRTKLWNAIQTIAGGLYRDGFSLVREDNFTNYASTSENPLFTTKYVLDESNAFRFAIMHDDLIIGRTAGRVLMSLGQDDFLRHLVGLDGTDASISHYPTLPQGMVSYGGTTWVHPDYRGARLSARLLWLMRYVAVAEYSVVAHIGHCRTPQMAQKLFGDTAPIALSGSLYRGDEKACDLYLSWITAGDIIGSIDKSSSTQ